MSAMAATPRNSFACKRCAALSPESSGTELNAPANIGKMPNISATRVSRRSKALLWVSRTDEGGLFENIAFAERERNSGQQRREKFMSVTANGRTDDDLCAVAVVWSTVACDIAMFSHLWRLLMSPHRRHKTATTTVFVVVVMMAQLGSRTL